MRCKRRLLNAEINLNQIDRLRVIPVNWKKILRWFLLSKETFASKILCVYCRNLPFSVETIPCDRMQEWNKVGFFLCYHRKKMAWKAIMLVVNSNHMHCYLMLINKKSVTMYRSSSVCSTAKKKKKENEMWNYRKQRPTQADKESSIQTKNEI